MGRHDGGAAQGSAAALRALVEQAYGNANADLIDLARTQDHAIRCAAQDDLRYVDPVDAAPRAIPAAQFHRQYTLCLETLELTLYGYCIERQFGWERRLEPAFSLRRPRLWRRVLRPAPLLAFNVKVGQDRTSVHIEPAWRNAWMAGRDYVVRLDHELQEQLAKVNMEQIAARSVTARLIKKVARWFK